MFIAYGQPAPIGEVEKDAVTTKYILAALSLVFLSLAVARKLRRAPDGGAQARTWLCIGGMFAAVSLWLFVRE